MSAFVVGRLLSIFLLVLACAQALPQVTFTISVTGTFSPTIPENCAYCDARSSSTYYTAPETACSSGSIPTGQVDDTQQRWGTPGTQSSSYCFTNSGAGFLGEKSLTLVANPTNDEPSKIGVFTHYNNVLNGNSVTPTKLRLTMNVTSSQLAQPFIISYPLTFFETENAYLCDPSLQYHSIVCDDRFSFDTDISLQSSFVYQNVRYTLELAGFLQDGGSTPVTFFSTLENNASRADVYARLITFCDSSLCSPNEAFVEDNCSCLCLINEDLCKSSLGPNWVKDEASCDCMCGITAANCSDGLTFNPESCSCGCNLTDAYCSSIDPSFEVTSECECGCAKNTTLYCSRVAGQFWIPAGNSCDVCVCAVTDDKCRDAFGPEYRADLESDNCGCVVPGGGGLSDGDIAGIVIGSVVGASVLGGLIIGAGVLLVYLIRAGKIAGIYGYKLEPALLDGVNDSPLYNSPWSNTNQLAG